MTGVKTIYVLTTRKVSADYQEVNRNLRGQKKITEQEELEWLNGHTLFVAQTDADTDDVEEASLPGFGCE